MEDITDDAIVQEMDQKDHQCQQAARQAREKKEQINRLTKELASCDREISAWGSHLALPRTLQLTSPASSSWQSTSTSASCLGD